MWPQDTKHSVKVRTVILIRWLQDIILSAKFRVLRTFPVFKIHLQVKWL